MPQIVEKQQYTVLYETVCQYQLISFEMVVLRLNNHD